MEDKKDDDEISIDAQKSKISGTHRKTEDFSGATEISKKFPSVPENSDEEFSLDLSKIKSFFKRKKEDEKKSDIHAPLESKEGGHEHHASEARKEEGKDDDEINIDFSKIKNLFKAGKSETHEEKEHKHGHQATESGQEKDDEISINFSKLKNIKNIFKKESKEASDEDVSVDFGKIKDFFVKHRVLLLLIIPIFLSIFLRVQPAYLPITDQWAGDSVINSIRSQIESQISQQYPNLPDQNKNALVENELQKVLQQQKSQIDQQIIATSDAFKSRLQDDTGQTYLVAIDPYFWMRHARNVIEKGHPGDELRDGRPYDNHMFAPVGRFMPFDVFHAYFIAFLYKVTSFFNRDVGLMAVTFYVPVIISALAVIPTFFIARKVAGDFAGFIAAAVVAIHPSFLTRTIGGFSDTDAYNVMFPLFIAWLFLEALDAKEIKKTVIFSAASGILVGLYSFTWGGWWYIFDFIIISTVLFMAYYIIIHRSDIMKGFSAILKQKAIKTSLVFLVVFFIVSALSVSLFVNFNLFTKFYKNPTGFAKLKEVGITTIWPNVFTTVAEQNPASLNNVINQVGLGEVYFFLIALIGITLTMTRRENKKVWFILGMLVWYALLFFLKDSAFVQDLNTFLILIAIPIIVRAVIAMWESDTGIDIKYAIFLILWFLATTFASTKGVRFTLLLVPAFAIGFGVALGQFYKYANIWITRLLHINKLVSKTTVIIALLLLLVAPYQSAANTAKNEIPSFNDAWRVSLEKIKEDSKPNAIINSWWDFGHWFKFWADRAVTFDGTSQNTPPAHWIGKMLLTEDEDMAVGILRMLDCGSREGFNLIAGLTKDGVESINLMNAIMPLDRENAKKMLLERFNEDDTEKVLEKTHCEPPENYFITSEDMVGKSGVWAHFGSWDFNRALIYNTLKKSEYKNNFSKSGKFLEERFGLAQKDAENLYYEVQSITDSNQANSWIAPWPGYAGVAGCSKTGNETLLCSISNIPLVINLTSKDAYAESTSGRLHPSKVSFPTEDGIILKKYDESTIPLGNGRSLGIALVKDGDNYNAVAMDSDLTGSMFTRMFYQDGAGLRYFKKFSDESSVFGNRIIVWKVDWEGKEDIAAAAEESAEPESISKDDEPVNGTNTPQDTL